MKKKKEDLKTKKKIHNYIILFVIILLSVGIVLYLCRWYEVYDEYEKEIPVIRDSLLEITNEDLEHYILDNPTAVIYMCTASSESCRSFEKDFVKLIQKEELGDKIIYLNLSNVDQEQFVKEFNEKYPYKVELTTNYPAFVIFEDGKVHSMLQGKENKKLTVSKVNQFLDLNKIGEEE